MAIFNSFLYVYQAGYPVCPVWCLRFHHGSRASSGSQWPGSGAARHVKWVDGRPIAPSRAEKRCQTRWSSLVPYWMVDEVPRGCPKVTQISWQSHHVHPRIPVFANKHFFHIHSVFVVNQPFYPIGKLAMFFQLCVFLCWGFRGPNHHFQRHLRAKFGRYDWSLVATGMFRIIPDWSCSH